MCCNSSNRHSVPTPCKTTKIRRSDGFTLVELLVVIGIIALGFSLALSSPDMPSVTIQGWSNADPVDFATTATAELAGTSGTATYGPPYTDGSDGVQAIGPFVPQQWFGNAMHLDTAQEFVLAPLTTVSGGDATVTDAIAAWKAASADQQQAWASAYTDALANATADNGKVTVAAGDYGPVPTLIGRLTAVAQAGALDGLLFTGSASDISPRQYGGVAPRKGSLQDERRDETALPLLRAATDAGKPVLCICRGCQ